MIHLKQPDETRIYEISFAELLGGETIASVVNLAIQSRGRVAEVLPLVIVEQGFDESSVRSLLQGGTAGEVYLFTVVVDDAVGQRHEPSLEIQVEDLSFTVPGGGTAYVDIASFVERVGLDDAVRLTDETGTGRIGKARLVRVLLDAQAEADGYLATRYDVPLAEVPQLVENAVSSIARAALYRDELPDGVKAARDQAYRTLEKIAAGTMKLPASIAATPAPGSAGSVLISSGGRTWTRNTLKGF